jgi:hypothetical protein
MSPARRTAVVVVVALLGIALAAAITWGTSQLVRQRIGLASEPLTAGRRLLPRVARSPARIPHPSTGATRARNSSSQTRPSPAPSTAAPSPPASGTAVPREAPYPSAPQEPAAESPAPARGRRAEGGGGDASAHRDD